MGLDPNDPTYDPGVACPECAAVIFDTVTPKYLLATVTDIEKCPVSIGEPPNGSYILEQVPGFPCEWTYSAAGLVISLLYTPGNSNLKVNTPATFWFLNDTAIACLDFFENQLACSPFISRGHLGQVTLFWGPQIGKEPIS